MYSFRIYAFYFSDSAECVEPVISDDDAKRLASEVMLLMPEVIHKMKQYDHLNQWIECIKIHSCSWKVSNE